MDWLSLWKHTVEQCWVAVSEWTVSQLTWTSHLLIRASGAPPAWRLTVVSSWKRGKRPGPAWLIVSDTAWCSLVVLQDDTENVAGQWIIPNCCHWGLIQDQYSPGRERTRRRRKKSLSECATWAPNIDLTLSVLVNFAFPSTGHHSCIWWFLNAVKYIFCHCLLVKPTFQS